MKTILLDILAPILLLVLLGAIMRWKFKIDLGTLSKLNIYLFLPAFVFDKVSTSNLNWAEMGGIAAMASIQVLALGLIVWGIGAAFHIGHKTLAAVALAVMFYNSGNYGIPLAELAYPSKLAAVTGKDGAAVQTFVMLTQNFLTFTLGLALAAWAGSGGLRNGMITLLRLPVFPTLAAALLARWFSDGDRENLPKALSATAGYLSNGLVAIALVTMGAQLASNPRWPRWRPVALVLVLRLVFAPMLMAGLLWVFHRKGGMLGLWPWPAEVMILTAATPTAINTLLLTMELDGDTDLAADCVFWSTVLSAVTITGWLAIMQWRFAR